MRYPKLFVALFLFTWGYGQSQYPVANWIDPETPPNAQPVGIAGEWVLDFSDEFNTTAINPAKWTVSVSTTSRNPRPNLGVNAWYWVEQNAFLDGQGHLVLRGTKVDQHTMHCGSVESRGLYEPAFGYLEARIKIAETAKGNHTAFWLQGHNQSNVDNSAADGAEVDIFESAWLADLTKAVVHFDGYREHKKNHTIPYNTPNLHTGFHIFGLHWTPTGMDIYYDGVKVESTNPGKPFPFVVNPNGYPLVPQVPEWLWLSVGASFADGDFQSQPAGFLSDALVDYVRVYKPASSDASGHLVSASDYYVHPTLGNDQNDGSSRSKAIRTLAKASTLPLQPGDRILLAAGQTYHGTLRLTGRHGNEAYPIAITSASWDQEEDAVPALINFKSEPNGILLEGCSFIQVSNIRLTGNGYHSGSTQEGDMRCGVLITNHQLSPVSNITLEGLYIFDVFFENPGFRRGAEEVRTANGTQRYGWGIRVINRKPEVVMTSIRIENCEVKNVAHTGIKFTGQAQNIRQVVVSGNQVRDTGGPGIQMSEVRDVHVINNTTSHSGSNDDTRKWGRGSGLWTWGSSRVLIEKNSFLYANGPGDSAGAHIDFNCDNIILQYNLSAYNAGGFCEVLGNTYNCAYRYNVSINDGWRVKGVDGAFQEGKIFWLSGYQGQSKPRKGPVNFYFYNNTIYCDSSLTAKIAIDNTSKGILIANNIFYLKGGAQSVLGDQYKPDVKIDKPLENVVFQNNVFLNPGSWPGDMVLKDIAPRFGNPDFANEGGDKIEDYIPKNSKLLKRKGVKVGFLPGDPAGLYQPMHPGKDILGNRVKQKTSIGAIKSY